MISTAVRRCATAVLSLATLVGVSLLLAGPAAADTPMPKPGGWEENPETDPVQWLLLFVGVPLLLMLVITALYVGPPLARGEKLNPAKQEPDQQWIGGPRKSAGELAAPDGEDSKAGGAGGTW